jgi:hypothetical protein
MKWSPSPQQTFLVLSMLFAENEEERNPRLSSPAVRACKKPSTWHQLKNQGWVRDEKRGRSTFLSLGDDAWDFLAENLGSPLPASSRAAELLERVLRRTRAFLATHDHSLADFVDARVRERSSGTAESAALAGANVSDGQSDEETVRNACLELAQHQTRRRVRLKDVRARVGASRDSLDRTLLSMQRSGRIVLYKLDNPAEISAEDEAAALFIAGEPRHIVYLEA